jgi:hypothetical protein
VSSSDAGSRQDLPWPMSDPRGGINLQNWGDQETTITAHCGLPHTMSSTPCPPSQLLTIQQQGQQSEGSAEGGGGGGIIGSYIWASSVVVSRFFIVPLFLLSFYSTLSHFLA